MYHGNACYLQLRSESHPTEHNDQGNQSLGNEITNLDAWTWPLAILYSALSRLKWKLEVLGHRAVPPGIPLNDNFFIYIIRKVNQMNQPNLQTKDRKHIFLLSFLSLHCFLIMIPPASFRWITVFYLHGFFLNIFQFKMNMFLCFW